MIVVKHVPSYFYIFCIWLAALPALTQESRHALLVAIGNYTDSSGWTRLSSTNDIRLIKKGLMGQGFDIANIATLKDHAATKSGILHSIQQHLAEKVKPGDIAVFHFSGHGQQVWDDNGDEIDGLDEALVPYDSPKDYKEGVYEGEQLLRDDELGKAILGVRRKLGSTGHLIVMIDACHSGTSTRGRRIARGTDVIMASSFYLEQIKSWNTDANSFLEEKIPDEELLASMVLLVSSSPNQLSYEYRNGEESFGLFTHAFSKALSNLSENATYRSLLDQIKLEVSSFTQLQTPQAEGSVDQLVFGEGVRQAPQYFLVTETFTTKMLLINGGELQGLTKGSRVALYPMGTIDTTSTDPLAFGSVDEASTFDADIELDRPLTFKDSKSARVFLRERNFGHLNASLEVLLTDSILKKELEQHLAKFPFIELVDHGADLYLEIPTGLAGSRQMVLSQNDDTQLWAAPLDKVPTSEHVARQLFTPIAQYVKANYLRSLESKSRRIRAGIQVLVKNDAGQYQPLGNRSLKIGESVKLEITNSGLDGFYFTLLDIQPNHKIKNICPGQQVAADYYLDAGGTFSTSSFTVAAPTGAEVLKIIATAEPLDLDFTRSQGNSFKNPLEVLLSTLLLPGSDTRGETPALPREVGFVGSLLVEIVK